jgi:hypothetical protein
MSNPNMEEAILRFLQLNWTPLSARVAKGATEHPLPDSELLTDAQHKGRVLEWSDSLKRMEWDLTQRVVSDWQRVPAAAPLFVMEATSDLMQAIMSYMLKAAGVFKAYVQMFGLDTAGVKQLHTNLEAIIRAASAVALDSMVTALAMRADKQTGSTNPALAEWGKRHDELADIWAKVLGPTPDPEQIAGYSLRYQAALAQYAKERNPKLRDIPPPTDDDFQRMSAQTKIPVEELRKLFPEDTPMPTQAGTQAPGEYAI